MLHAINKGDYESFIALRTECLQRYLRFFLDDKTGEGFEITPPLSDFDLDDDGADERSNQAVATNGDCG